GRRRIDMGIAVGADQTLNRNAVAADVLHEIAEDRETRNHGKAVLRARGSGKHERGKGGEYVSSSEHGVLLFTLRGAGPGKPAAPNRRRDRTAERSDRVRRRPR